MMGLSTSHCPAQIPSFDDDNAHIHRSELSNFVVCVMSFKNGVKYCDVCMLNQLLEGMSSHPDFPPEIHRDSVEQKEDQQPTRNVTAPNCICDC